MNALHKHSSLLAALGLAFCVNGAVGSARGQGALPAAQPDAAAKIPDAAGGEPRGLFHGVGVVIAVAPKSGALTVKHADIKGFMPAMEMMFRVDPPSLSDGLRKGDKIAFTIEGPGGIIRAVRLIERAE